MTGWLYLLYFEWNQNKPPITPFKVFSLSKLLCSEFETIDKTWSKQSLEGDRLINPQLIKWEQQLTMST